MVVVISISRMSSGSGSDSSSSVKVTSFGTETLLSCSLLFIMN